MATTTKKTKTAAVPGAIAPTDDSTPPASRELKAEGVAGVIAAGWSWVVHPGESSIRRHLAAQFYPWKTAAAVWGAGLVTAPVAQLSVTHAIVAAIATGAGAWAALRLLRTLKAHQLAATRRAAQWAEMEPAHARVCVTVAAVWVIAVIVIGPTTVAAWYQASLAGVVPFLLLASRYWAHHRTTRVPGAQTDRTETSAPPPPGEHPVARKWRTRIATGSGCLPRTKITDLVEESYGIRGKLHLVPGKQTLSSVRSVAGYIATALGVSEADVLIEEVEATEDDPKPDSSILDLKVITTGLLAAKIPLEGDRLFVDGDDVLIRLGPYVDGDGEARWRLYTTDSIWGGFVAGSTGSGKSGLIDALALGIWQTGNTILIYLDPKNGGSSPRIFDRAHWAIGNDPATWDAVLDGLIEVIEARGLENSARLKTSGFTPSPTRPGIVVVVEECHAVITSANAERWGRVGREGRAAGVQAIYASQIYGLQTFAGDDAVRSSATAGNTIALRVSRNQASMIADIPLDPSTLPKITGVGLADAGREVPFKAAWAPSEATAAQMDTALARAPHALDPLAAGAFDAGSAGLYSRRHEIADQQIHDAEDRLRAYEAGHTPARDQATGPQVALANLVDGITPSVDIPEIDPDLLTDRDLGLGVLAETEHRFARWSGAARAVLIALADGGVLRRGDLEKTVMASEECSRATVSRALDDLAEAGEITALPNRRGWQLTA